MQASIVTWRGTNKPASASWDLLSQVNKAFRARTCALIHASAWQPLCTTLILAFVLVDTWQRVKIYPNRWSCWCRSLADRAREYTIHDLQPLFDSSVFQTAGFSVSSDGESITLRRSD